MKIRVSVLALLAAAVVAAVPAKRRISPEFDKLNPGDKVRVIVQFERTRGADHDKLRRLGGQLERDLPRALNGGQFILPVAAARALATDSDVRYISVDRRLRGSLEFAAPAVYANIAWQYGWTGAGVGVAVLDSGVSTGMLAHPDLRGQGGMGNVRVVYSESFVAGDASTDDAWGHGEHVAGIIGGNASSSSGSGALRVFRGIAPGVNIVNLRVLDSKGSGTDASVIAAIDRAIALKSTYNIRVLNLSLGRPVRESYDTDPLCQAVERAWEAGIVVVVAAGNDGRSNYWGTRGYGTIASPANDPYVITVGAMRDMGTASRADDLLASYSSKGPTAIDHFAKPDLVAPGNQIISLRARGGPAMAAAHPSLTVPATYYKSGATTSTPSAYLSLSGTSMAAPMVSGAAALMIQKDPSLAPDVVKARLMHTATKMFPVYSTYTDITGGTRYTLHYDLFTTGAGYLDVWAALNSTLTVPTGRRALSPRTIVVSGRVMLDSGSQIDSSYPIWGSSAQLMSTSVWGSLVSGTNVIWGGEDQVWGDPTLSGNAALWGTNVIWGGDDSSGDTSYAILEGDL